ncbi:MAG: F0F1 ATP synthase subunit B [Candidatus Manganitrophus sp.]|nr:F0F1 ATP synthase subunit B [Candidatus Manganitrophus sp.]MDC4223530.1 F0F1 ATP synthase subunit B [Candidatus Manganitrophus sp.]WDT70654.1 MAG: F0F1 ATP synthase subunit B [Candidatus Manganitrophus sp.]WDT77091.1 MAG: F0F1 ATP synthase subunit B [Candidatus Manganitrophus sp.]WDT82085.1 MAG: F0F1 ATP synthase subunit B [Candidatus Manganitrophus sp.]
MDIQIQQVLTQIVGFLLLLWLLRKFAWGPLLGVLDERRTRIASELEEIRKGKESLAQIKTEYDTKLSEIENQARLRIQEAVVEGQRMAREMAEGAREEAHQILEKAKEDIQREMAKAKAQLRDEIATIAVSAAGKIVRQEMNKQKDKELVLQYIDELKGFK